MNITMIGSGYVGLVSDACFADFGHKVICVDADAGKIERLQCGEIPIYEPGLDELVANNVKQERLSFTIDLAPAVKSADAVFIAVGTPSRRGDGHADLSFVYAAAQTIASALDGFTEWDACRALDLDRVKALLKQPIIVDLRNIYRPAEARKRGFAYVSVGREHDASCKAS